MENVSVPLFIDVYKSQLIDASKLALKDLLTGLLLDGKSLETYY